MKPLRSLTVVVAFGLIIAACDSGNDPPQGGAPPATPTGLTADAGDGEVTLTWDANSEENLSHYNVYQGTSAGNLTVVGEAPVGTESYTATQLTNDTTYYFSIDAENDDGKASEPAGEVSATPQAAQPVRYEDVWVNQFGSSADDSFGILGIAYASDGTLWAVGHLGASFEGVGGPFVARFNSNDGTRLSIEALDFPVVPVRPNAIAFTGDGGYLVAGGIFGSLPGQTQAGTEDAFVAKFDSDGSYQWGEQVGGGSWAEAHAVVASPAGDIYVVGWVHQDAALPGQTASGGGRDVFLIKYDDAGNRLWIRQFGNGSDRMWGHGVTLNGNEIVALGDVSDTGSPIPGATSSGNTFIRRYDASGNALGSVQIEVPVGDNENRGMIVDESGALWVFGSGSDPFGYGNEGARDFVAAKVDPATGDIAASLQVGTTGSDWGDAISLGASGEVYVGGATNGSFPGHTNAGGYDVAIARLEHP